MGRWSASHWRSHRCSKARQSWLKSIVLIAKEAIAALEYAGPDTARNCKENDQKDDGKYNDGGGELAGITPAVYAIVDFSVDGADAFLDVIARLERKLLGTHEAAQAAEENSDFDTMFFFTKEINKKTIIRFRLANLIAHNLIFRLYCFLHRLVIHLIIIFIFF